MAVTIAERIHLFPSRTQKLSSLTPKVLGLAPGRIGSCRLSEKTDRSDAICLFVCRTLADRSREERKRSARADGSAQQRQDTGSGTTAVPSRGLRGHGREKRERSGKEARGQTERRNDGRRETGRPPHRRTACAGMGGKSGRGAEKKRAGRRKRATTARHRKRNGRRTVARLARRRNRPPSEPTLPGGQAEKALICLTKSTENDTIKKRQRREI